MKFAEFKEFVQARIDDEPEAELKNADLDADELIFGYHAEMYAENLQELPTEELAEMILEGDIEQVNAHFVELTVLEDIDNNEARELADAIWKWAKKDPVKHG